MTNEKISYDRLPAEVQQMLTAKYGIQSKNLGGFSKYAIDYIRSLTDNEKMFFQEKSFLTPHFLTQSLYKLKGNFQPVRFNAALKETVKKNPALRTNYTQLDDTFIAVVFEKRTELPSVNFRSLITIDSEEIDKTLRTIMEADMRENFDLIRGSLIRFSIYKTQEDEYAILVTMSHLIFSQINLNEIFCETLGLSVAKAVEKNIDASFNVSDPNARAYWKKILGNLPKLPIIPYLANNALAKKESKVYRRKISGDLSSELQRIAKSNRMLLMAFIETAWCLLLSEYNDTNDVFFSALLPDKKGNSKVPSVRAMPVRIKVSPEISVEQLVMNTFQQLLISKPYSSVQVDELQEISGSSGRIFNHFLSFYNFMDEEKEYSETEGSSSGELVVRNSWNSIPAHIGLYFQQENGSVALTLIYNAGNFANSDETRLVDRFFRIILQMITEYNSTVSMCLTKFKERIKVEETQKVEKPNIDLYVRYAILSVDIFSVLNKEDLELLQNNAKIKTLFEGDRIFGEDLNENVIILTKGRAARNVDSGDGWYNTLDILKERSILNLSMVFLDKPKLPMSIEILTDESEIVFIKKTSFESVMRKNNLIAKNLMIYVLKEAEKYQYLWIQS